MKFTDLTGQTFGQRTVLKRMPSRRGQTMWLCRCSCGREDQVGGANIRRRRMCRSCGNRGHGLKHGMRGTREYKSWQAMLARCRDPGSYAYVGYGARGIAVCERWNDFENFLADMGPRPKGTTLDRLFNDHDYWPTNCRWRTPKQQNNNRRDNVLITFNGRTQSRSAWAQELGMSATSLTYRLRKKWPLEQALTQPPRHWGA